MKKAHTQKNTLLKTAATNRTTKVFKRVFFSPPQEEFQNFFPTAQKKIKTLQRTVRTSTVCASIVNRFEQSVCGNEQNRFGRTAAHAGNIRLKEILKKGALTVKRTVVHLSNSCGYTNSRASNPPFLKLL